MSRENVEIVRRLYEAVARHDADATLSLYDPGVEFDFSKSPFRDFVRQEVYSGYSGMRSFFRERYEDGWKDIADNLDELLDVGDQVVCVVTSRGRGRVSGAEVSRTHAAVWTLRNGRIVRVAWFDSRHEALGAVGLSE